MGRFFVQHYNRVELLNEMKKIQQCLGVLQVKMSDVETTLTKVLETQRAQDAEIKYLKEEVQQMKEEHRDILAEVEDRDRRKANLIISGLQEEFSGTAEERKKRDLSKVQSLFRALDGVSGHVISSVRRLGKGNSQKPRLLKVVCRDIESKRALLRKSKNLRGIANYRNVYLNPDLTPNQQEENKRFIEELKARRDLGENVVIQNGKVVTKTQNFQ